MNKHIFLRQKFEITNLPVNVHVTEFSGFSTQKNGFNVNIKVSSCLRYIEAQTKFAISDVLYQKINSHLFAGEVYEEGRQDLIDGGVSEARNSLLTAIRGIVDVLVFVTGYFSLDDNFAIGVCYCSLDGEHWEDVKKRVSTSSINSSWRVEHALNEKEVVSIQTHLLNDVEPFMATHHLYKAIKEKDIRHQLINLAFTLELGIKEYLVRKKGDSETEVLIQKLPSPPLLMLYTEVLKCFSGKLTPVEDKFFRDINRDRNKLVHIVAKNKSISSRPINEYIDGTKIVLYHLWLDLYPYDECIFKRYNALIEKNSSIIEKSRVN